MTEQPALAKPSTAMSHVGLEPLPAKQEYFGPRGFRWLIPGRLAGTPRPGLFYDVSTDLRALARVGISAVFTLTEEWDPAAHDFSTAGLNCHYFPIPDLCPPTTEHAKEICRLVDRYMQEDAGVVFHCHAGKGRTGTLLAAQFVWRGLCAKEAILATRAVNDKWIESDSQLEWLHTFETSLR